MPDQPLELEVVGMSYRLTTDTLRELSHKPPMNVILEREPNNPHDEYAIKVLLGDKRKTARHIGYVARQTAKVLAPRMDKGRFPFTEILLTDVDPSTGRGQILLRKGPRAKGKSQEIA